MLFTPIVNSQFQGLEGFVTACDFLTVADCPATNRSEVFYASVPTLLTTSDGSDPRYDLRTPVGWYNEVRGLVMHETKHITALAEKFSRGSEPMFDESWLEEATAQIARELYARTIYGTAWKGNATYQQTLSCEVRLCPGYSFLMFDHFMFLADYEAHPDSLSPLTAGWDDPTI